MPQTTRELLRSVVRQASPLGSDVRFADDTPILADGIIDSMGILGIMTEIERALGVTLPPEALVTENFQSIDTLAAMVEGLAGTEAAP